MSFLEVRFSVCQRERPEHIQDARERAAKPVIERREFGAVNIGGPVRVVADGETFDLDTQEAIYLGMGTKDVCFESLDAAKPA